jgi:hypothetical protein
VARTLWSIERKANGPSLCVVFHTAKPTAIVTASVAPRSPKRRAAQISVGKTR